MLRYRESGELHLDFHGSTNGAIEFITTRYGREGLRQILRETAHKVYRSIHQKLKAGDLSELAEHWRYFMEREQAEFELKQTADGLELTVRVCPAVRHLKKLGITPSPYLSCTLRDGLLEIEMHQCPSLGKALDNDAGASPRYCDHCPGWIIPLLHKAGFACEYDIIDHRLPRCRLVIYPLPS